jgi:hypothetical protein
LWTARGTLSLWFGSSWDISQCSWPEVESALAHQLGMDPSLLRRWLGKERSYIGCMVRNNLFNWRLGDLEVPFITYVTEWLIYLVVLPIVQNTLPTAECARDFPHTITPHANIIRRRALVVMIVTILTTPCILVMTLVYYLIRYGQFLRLSPTFLLSRHWSQYALWYTWRPNELRHEVTQRLQTVKASAELYAHSCSLGVNNTLVSTLRFYSSLVCVCLLLLMVLRDDFTDVSLAGHSLLWWVTLSATSYTVCHSLTQDPPCNMNDRASLVEIAKTLDISQEFFKCRCGVLFEYRILGFVKELITIALLPWLVYFAMYRRADDLASFVIHHSVTVEGVGNVLLD